MPETQTLHLYDKQAQGLALGSSVIIEIRGVVRAVSAGSEGTASLTVEGETEVSTGSFRDAFEKALSDANYPKDFRLGQGQLISP